jgi:fatty acid desaturase
MNLLICGAQILAWATLISVLHAPGSLAWKIPVALLFCLMMQGVFSLMHECFHGHGHPSATVNRLIGIATGTMFGTAYTLFRVNHEGHHVRNRSDAEIAEYILPGESAARKIFLYYFAILGGIWLGALVASVALPFLPYRLARFLNPPAKSMNGYSLSFAQFSRADWRSLRVEGAVGVVVWGAAIMLLGWDFRVLTLIYAAFAFSWSSLQWVYHMRTPLDRIEGAYDLRAPWPVRGTDAPLPARANDAYWMWASASATNCSTGADTAVCATARASTSVPSRLRLRGGVVRRRHARFTG